MSQPAGRVDGHSSGCRRRRALMLLFYVVLAGTAALMLRGQVGTTIVVGTSMEPTIDGGDMVITRKMPTYDVGDVIVYRIPEGDIGAGQKVIHRIIDGTAETGFVTAGDNREGADSWQPTDTDIIGIRWATIPAGGIVMLWLRSPIVILLISSVILFRLTLMLIDARPRLLHASVAAVERSAAPECGRSTVVAGSKTLLAAISGVGPPTVVRSPRDF